MSDQAGEICVAHLVRRSNDISALRGFLDSYRSFPAGAPHELLLIFKGFSAAHLPSYEAVLNGISHRRMFVRDAGFDVRPYLQVAREQPHRYFAFFNSFSRLLAPGWLESLYRNLRRPGVGVVGATGSHESFLSNNRLLRAAIQDSMPVHRRIFGRLRRDLRYIVNLRGRFPAFPNQHVRTNGFMISREVATRLRSGPVLTKWDAYRFESGAGSMTRQVMAAGLAPVVAGADGRAYAPAEWPQAKTFWIAGQENLLVADNQTRAYALGTPAEREQLALRAWRRLPDGTERTSWPAA